MLEEKVFTVLVTKVSSQVLTAFQFQSLTGRPLRNASIKPHVLIVLEEGDDC